MAGYSSYVHILWMESGKWKFRVLNKFLAVKWMEQIGHSREQNFTIIGKVSGMKRATVNAIGLSFVRNYLG